MATKKGAVERVAVKKVNTKYGEKNAIGIVVDGDWYNFLSEKKPEDLGIEEGSTVGFSYSENDYGYQLSAKSLKVAKGSGKKTKGNNGGQSATTQTAAISCGHAINNAVHLAVADGDTSPRAIHKHAVDILTLTTCLQGQYDKIVEAARKGSKVVPDVEEQEGPAKKGQPEPEPEEEEPDVEPEEEEEIEFSDDLPF